MLALPRPAQIKPSIILQDNRFRMTQSGSNSNRTLPTTIDVAGVALCYTCLKYLISRGLVYTLPDSTFHRPMKASNTAKMVHLLPMIQL